MDDLKWVWDQEGCAKSLKMSYESECSMSARRMNFRNLGALTDTFPQLPIERADSRDKVLKAVKNHFFVEKVPQTTLLTLSSLYFVNEVDRASVGKVDL